MTAWLTLFAAQVLAMAAPEPADVAPAADCVILLHGMARTNRSMRRMAEALSEDNYTVVNEGYPSRKYPIEALAPLAVGAGMDECRRRGAAGRVHFVTHSLGGILVRFYAAQHDIPNLGRVVMLAPPNAGSAAADKWSGFPGFDWLNGPAAWQLGKGDASVPRRLGPATFELGIIAGDRSIDPVTSAMLVDPDDGRVSVEDTKLEGMRDFRVVHATHAFMMRNQEVIELTRSFLAHGHFGTQTLAAETD